MRDDPAERSALEAERAAFAAEIGQFFEERGLPRTEGQMVGWLVVCDPPEQSADDLASALGASRGGISTAIRYLQRVGAVERVAAPGSRRHYYRLRPGIWRQDIDNRVEEAVRVRDLAAKGLERMSTAPPEQLDRLRDMNDMYTFLAQEFQQTQQRWREHEKEQRER
ncbi:DNA-binding transcriptional regulator GbsR (MarR family) [Lipingzhangella halophila]|uniref:DNA-binding transcriptional regulator GbsR (MarR family) n=1 Tax=Lipingzhangella halophila TaxID=1783352 RepID=A0A7W7RIS0_9ACTN|nr:transcriptional regulator [Lipingzhangella halophila]MBB4932690.1 DNA-binding transcriptional regulator GbsR (MarR family) [Lipingzhangella halophila]